MAIEMEKLVSLCKRRGFLFQSSEIYGGLNGFWDYGPLGVELKRNVKEAWWQDMVNGHDDLNQLEGAPSTFEMVGLDCSIIMHPQVWKCSGTTTCSTTTWSTVASRRNAIVTIRSGPLGRMQGPARVCVGQPKRTVEEDVQRNAMKYFKIRNKDIDKLAWDGGVVCLTDGGRFSQVVGPDAREPGTLTEPREFNLMFKTFVGALSGEEGTAFLRPETAQGIFVNFKNVVDSTRVRIPFGIAQVGKSFRNEITPRNFTFRSREFEQMEVEFFCHPDDRPIGTSSGAIAASSGTRPRSGGRAAAAARS